MTTKIETTDGALAVPDYQIRAVVRHAEHHADLTIATLDAMGLLTTKPVTSASAFRVVEPNRPRSRNPLCGGVSVETESKFNQSRIWA